MSETTLNEPLLSEEERLDQQRKYQLAKEEEKRAHMSQQIKRLAEFEKKALAANLENPDKFTSSKIDYFSEDGLVPQTLQVSGRYVAILFEANNGRQEYHVIHRYTHDLVMRVELNTSIKDFFIYDPFDCARYHSNKNSMAYIVNVLWKRHENSNQKLTITKIQPTAQPYTKKISQPAEASSWASMAAVSADFKYAALSLVQDQPAAEYFGDGSYTHIKVQFVSIGKDLTMTRIGLTKGAVARNPSVQNASVVFLGNQAKALIAYPSNFIALTDVLTGIVLSKVNISGHRVDMVYFQDIDQYSLLTMDESSSFAVKFEDDQIELQKEEPLAYFDSKSSKGLCTSENPYNFSMKSLNGSFNNSQTTGFIINQRFFNLHMNDIKFSRVQILPGVKVFYSIKNSAPYTCNVLDLTNLDVRFQATVLDSEKACIKSYSSGKTTQIILDDKSMKKTFVSHNVKTISSFKKFVEQTLPEVDLSDFSYFDIQKKYIIVKVGTNLEIYDIETRQKLFSEFGVKTTISDDGNALILNKGAYQFQVWEKDPTIDKFGCKVAFFKNVASRVDFIPGSNTKVALYDERLKSLLGYDIEQGTYSYIVKNAEFQVADYSFIDENLLRYEVKQNSGEMKTFIFNYLNGFLENAKGLQGNIILIKESINKKFLYATTEETILVFDKENLTQPIQRYPINSVFGITEYENSAVLLCRSQMSIRILEIGTLLPESKLNDDTSSQFLMRYIFDVLSSKEHGLTEKLFVVDAYSVFMKNGFVDTYFDDSGITLLHQLINEHTVDVFSKLFFQSDGTINYLRSFEGVSPLAHAINLSKMQHVRVMIDYFAANPDKITLSHEDFLCLMQLGLPEAKTIIFNQFKQPETYRCLLPFQVNYPNDLYIKPIQSHTLGQAQVSLIEEETFNPSVTKTTLYSYSMSKFKYNFTRGSQSSLDFLKAYSEEEDENVLRSHLRFIVDQKFEESKPFLLTIAGIFYCFLILYMYAILTRDRGVTVMYSLAVFNTFFIGLEMRQVFKMRLEYFADFWNYIDISVFVINYFLFFYTGDIQNTFVELLYSISCFLMLLRGMAYLRIFSALRYLINMVVEIMKDMSAFTILLIYWVVGYSFIFYIFADITSEDGAENPFVTTLKECYRLAYGDFDPTDYDAAKWIAFVIATFFLPLVMLNMVIALMGDTFGRVKEASAAVDMKEKAAMVLEAESFVSWRVPQLSDEEEAKKRQYILIGYNQDFSENDIQVVQASQTDALIEKTFKGLQESMSQFQKEILSAIKGLQKQQQQQQQQE